MALIEERGRRQNLFFPVGGALIKGGGLYYVSVFHRKVKNLCRNETGDRSDADAERYRADRAAQAPVALFQLLFLRTNNNHPFHAKILDSELSQIYSATRCKE